MLSTHLTSVGVPLVAAKSPLHGHEFEVLRSVQLFISSSPLFPRTPEKGTCRPLFDQRVYFELFIASKGAIKFRIGYFGC
jgi:hypothetical protein